MPSRAASFVIIAFWLFTAGWYLHREVVPRFLSEAPPPYVIDLADEALRHAVPERWTLFYNGRRITSVRTSIEYQPRDDSYEMKCTVIGDCEIARVGNITIKLLSFLDSYWVNRKGELLGTSFHAKFSAAGIVGSLDVNSVVRSDRAELTCRFNYPGGEIVPKLEPIPLSRAGIVNTLHPVHRIPGLRTGMQWQVPMTDPRADILWYAIQGLAQKEMGGNATTLVAAPKPRTLVAEVVGPREMEFRGRKESCHVIEYRGDDFLAHTWVRISDAAVLRQDATSQQDETILERE